MGEIWFEIVIVFLLLLINGVFAMTEIAVVSARKARLRQMADQGSSGSKVALELSESPSQFLATVQVGITLVGIFAGAFGGATIAEIIDDWLQSIPVLAPYGESIGLGIVVICITYFSLVIGELVPKRIALGNPEGIASRVAVPMKLLSKIASPGVRLLSASTDALLYVLPFKPSAETAVTEEEIRLLMQEGLRSGAFNEVESEIVHSALELDQLTVEDIMTPRIKITWLDKNEPHEAVWHKIAVSGHTFFPVYEGTRDNIVGIVSIKALYANLAAGLPARIPDLMTDPLVVPATQPVMQLLDTFRRTGKHIALVVDEFGGIDGLVALNDVMEAILGDFPSREERLRPDCKQRADGTWLVDGLVSIDRLQEILPGLVVSDEDAEDVQTLAGLVMKRLGRIPNEGEQFRYQDFQFEVIDMDRHRVDKLLIGRAPQQEEPEE
ncbi:MAG: HlyC/CorC family transporter [Candidatus Hydrogenedentes bacterium]|nr:HlyC/CorC family transporter [Candidatus Hydrogenedentota bacterium]